jgi:hypothetical protein
MVGEIFGLTPTFQGHDARGQTTLFAKPINLRSESTENRALTPSKLPSGTTLN